MWSSFLINTLHLGGSHCNWDNNGDHPEAGNTKIILPIDLELHLQINTLYGDLKFWIFLSVKWEWNHRYWNGTLSEIAPFYKKIVLVEYLGDVEVILAHEEIRLSPITSIP